MEKSALKAALGDDTYQPVFRDSPVCHSPLGGKPQTRHAGPYDELSHLDFELHRIVAPVAEALNRLDSSFGNPEHAALVELENGIKSIQGSLPCIHQILCKTLDEMALQQAMLERYGDMLKGMEQAVKTIQSRETPKCTPRAYSNRECQLICIELAYERSR
jgi:hypothetical protein